MAYTRLRRGTRGNWGLKIVDGCSNADGHRVGKVRRRGGKEKVISPPWMKEGRK